MSVQIVDVKVEQTGAGPDGISGFRITFNDSEELSLDMNAYQLQTLMEVVKTMGAGIKFSEFSVKF